MTENSDLILRKLEQLEGKVDKLRDDYHRGDKALAVFQTRVYTFAGLIAIGATAAWDWVKSVFF